MSAIEVTILGQLVSRVTYIYALCDERAAWRYIGKSDSPHERFKRHMHDASDIRKARWIKAMGQRGFTPTLQILQVVPFDAWQIWERHWIEAAELSGASLTNSTAGGIGPLSPSQESREKMRAAKVGRKQTEEHRAKVSEALRGKAKPRRSEAHSAAISAACRGRQILQEHRAKLVRANMARTAAGSTGLKGVYADVRGGFKAQIKVAQRNRFLGRFEDKFEAAKAYNAAAIAQGYPPEGLNPV